MENRSILSFRTSLFPTTVIFNGFHIIRTYSRRTIIWDRTSLVVFILAITCCGSMTVSDRTLTWAFTKSVPSLLFAFWTIHIPPFPSTSHIGIVRDTAIVSIPKPKRFFATLTNCIVCALITANISYNIWSRMWLKGLRQNHFKISVLQLGLPFSLHVASLYPWISTTKFARAAKMRKTL